MANKPLEEERDLVSLYAARIRSRGEGTTVETRGARPAPGVHHFGRQRRAQRRSSRWQKGGAASALVAGALLAGAQGVGAAITHDVQPGDTLSEIALQYGTTVPQLATINGIPDPDFILAGTTLTIEPDTTLDPDAAVARYEVQEGDTLSAIAQQFGVTVDAIVAANGIANPDLITVGAVLLIPPADPGVSEPTVSEETGAEADTPESTAVGPTAPESTESTPVASETRSTVPSLHLVVSGETLGEIAKAYGTTVELIAHANAIADPNQLLAGSLLQIPAADAEASEVTAPVAQDDGVLLQNMPVTRQSLPLSSEAAAASITTAYWGSPVSEWVFIENLPSHPNPHRGFRGNISGAFGGTRDYGVYAEPLAEILQRYGFVGEVFYAQGDADLLRQQIDQGRPVIAWITNRTSVQQRGYAWHDEERFVLVPEEHTVVVYGYDAERVYVADPGDGAYRSFSWDDFLRSWGYFDGMALAVYPA